MKKKILFLILLLMVVFKYNPMTNRWETVYPDAKLQYNPLQDQWRYISPPQRFEWRYDSPDIFKFPDPTYNPFQDKWEWPH